MANVWAIEKGYVMDEIWDILIALLALVLAVTWVWGGDFASMGIDSISSFIIFLFAVGIGFIAHEMAHKWMAIRFGAAARFVLWPNGLLLLFILAFAKVIFAATGAVYIYKAYLSKRESGIISAAGPATNLAICGVFLAVLSIAPALNITLIPIVEMICLLGIKINAFLALFNLIPFSVLDGAKVMAWDWKVWLGLVLISIFLWIFL